MANVFIQLGLLILFAYVVSVTADDKEIEKCPKNQIYHECPSCIHKCGEDRPACNRNCVPGCTCPEGLFLNKKGKCVEECGGKKGEEEEKCPKNQIYSECPSCIHKCGEDRPACNRNCEPGCTCPEGMFLNRKGKCVEECGGKKGKDEEKCPKNQIFSECPSCIHKCGEDRPACNRNCEPGCTCPEGLFLNRKGKCVEECGGGKKGKEELDDDEDDEEEQMTCPMNQVYLECKPCLNTCDGMRKCNRNCLPGCGCPEDLPYQLEDGSCTLDCPVTELPPMGCPLHGCTAEMLSCESGELAEDENGCVLCQCAEAPDLPPMDCPLHSCTAEMLECKNGKLAEDENGCEFCVCKEEAELPMGCPLHGCTAKMLSCESGELAEDENGCVLCQCAEGDVTDEEGRGDAEDEGPIPAPEEESCPFNQVYTECKNCDERCGKRKRCYRNCVAGCACPEELPFQTKKGKCVAECPAKKDDEKKCPSNQVYSECAGCPIVCGKKKQKKCNRNCMPGCGCPEDLPYQTKKGKCLAECPAKKGKGKRDVPKCPKGQKFSTCATPCPLVCGQPRPQICIASCKPGCACPEGRWLREDGKCVKEKKCPK